MLSHATLVAGPAIPPRCRASLNRVEASTSSSGRLAHSRPLFAAGSGYPIALLRAGGGSRRERRSLNVAVRAEYRREPGPDRGGRPTYEEDYGNYSDYDSFSGRPNRAPPPPPPPPNGGWGTGGGGGGNNNRFTQALLAGAFVIGIGTGVWFDKEVNFEPSNVASTEIIDRKTPNSEVCMANGYSSMVFDQRLFVSFNPFNVYVAQTEVKPGCVLRRANMGELERRGLIDNDEVKNCKRNMNTFAFVGDLNKSPEVSCVYHSEEAENQFMADPRRANMGDGNRPKIVTAPGDKDGLPPLQQGAAGLLLPGAARQQPGI